MNRREFIRVGAAVTTMASWDTAVRAAIEPSDCLCKTMTAAQFHAARKFVVTECGRIAYLDIGEGSVALFLHGFPLNSFQWREAIPGPLNDEALHCSRLAGTWIYGGG